ncbi:uncharacterized protein [Neodiprion pinetum]|uniref:uncharacterized protein n=1 Tax=Neodiprion pinetum TaxID=441929 RepID=UPI001EE129C0|nr:uncharacterized protein LOC124223676 [Neodiprion pinetum]
MDADTWIDVCAVSHLAAHDSWRQSGQPFLSSHDLIYFWLKYNHPKSERRLIKCLSWKEADFAAATELVAARLHESDEDQDNSLQSVDSRLSKLNNLFKDVVDQCVPVREFIPERSSDPWITWELREVRRQRDRYYRRFKRNGHRLAWEEYVSLRREAQSLWRKNQASYLQTVSNRAGNTKQFWSEMNRLGLTVKARKSRDVLRFGIEELNDYYATVVDGRKHPSLDEVVAGLSRQRAGVLFDFARVRASNIIECVSVGTSRAEGIDGLSTHILKTFKDLFGPLIADLVNLSSNSGYYPTLWRSSLITPIPKTRGPQSVVEMLPISILCAMSKVCERVVLDQVVCFLNDYNVLDSRQTGFRQGMGTQTAVVKVVDDVRFGIDKQLVTLAVFLDLTKAFDFVDHLLLLSKLYELGFSLKVIRWMYCYLAERKHAVRDSDKVSTWRKYVTGVPRGSVLGLLVFSLFINELPKCLRLCSHLSFADDRVVHLTCKVSGRSSAIEKMNED